MIRHVDEMLASDYDFLVLCVDSGMIGTEQLQKLSLVETFFLPVTFSQQLPAKARDLFLLKRLNLVKN